MSSVTLCHLWYRGIDETLMHGLQLLHSGERAVTVLLEFDPLNHWFAGRFPAKGKPVPFRTQRNWEGEGIGCAISRLCPAVGVTESP